MILWTTLLNQPLKRLGLYLLGQNCLHLTFEQYLSSETYSRKYETLPNIVILACKNITKNAFVENVWPANLALFIYVSTHCVEIVKWLEYNRYCQLTRWCSGNASALGARGPGLNPRIRQGFYADSWITQTDAQLSEPVETQNHVHTTFDEHPLTINDGRRSIRRQITHRRTLRTETKINA